MAELQLITPEIDSFKEFPLVPGYEDSPVASVRKTTGEKFYQTIKENRNTIREKLIKAKSYLKLFCESGRIRSAQGVGALDRVGLPVVKRDINFQTYGGGGLGDDYNSLMAELYEDDTTFDTESGLIHLSESPNEGFNQCIFYCKRNAFDQFVRRNFDRAVMKGMKQLAQRYGLEKLPVNILIVEVNEDEHPEIIAKHLLK